jgi:glucose-6-phosphate 1-dehydrogenase
LLDSIRGDATLFTRRDEVEAEWRIITPIEEAWARLPAPAFPNYAAGSDGPAEADALLRGGHPDDSRGDRHEWRRLGETPASKRAV